MQQVYQSRAELARSLAKKAGDAIREVRRSGAFVSRDKAPRDPVTTADTLAEQIILEGIRAAFPDDTILSEESTAQGVDLRAPFLWVVDPIDGTVNFARDHGHSAVSIAFCASGRVEVGVVYNPFADELFFALRGAGAMLNGKPIQCSVVRDTGSALVATGFPYVRDHTALLAKRAQSVLENCMDIRRFGACSLDLCWVACGRFDAFYEDVEPWDMAAGALIVREAGGVTGIYLEEPRSAHIPADLRSTHVLATNGQLWDAMATLLVTATNSE